MQQEIRQAIESRAWYPLVGIIVTLILRAWAAFGPAIAVGVLPRRWQWVPAVVITGLAAFVDSQQSGASWVVAVTLCVYAIASAGGVAIGAHHTAKRITEKPE